MAKAKKTKNILTDEDMKPQNAKWNITIRMSGDLLDAYRAEAARLGIGYQTLMQMKLREAIANPLEKRVEAIEHRLKMSVDDSKKVLNVANNVAETQKGLYKRLPEK